MDKPRAPWTPDQVDSLALRQRCGYFHEYTGYVGETKYTLLPTEAGWLAGDTLVQEWAHGFDTDWSWVRSWRSQIDSPLFAERVKQRFNEFKDLAGRAKAKTIVSSRADEYLETEEGARLKEFELEGFLFALELLQELGGWWFGFLYQFMPNGPVIPEESRGRLDDITRIFIDWAHERGFLDTNKMPDEVAGESPYFEWLHGHMDTIQRERADTTD